MKSKSEFKTFVKSHPELVSYVKKGEATWQKFYELYSLYDEDDTIWKNYLNKDNDISLVTDNKTKINFNGINEIFNMIRNIKPETLQQNINSIQKFLSFVSEFIDDSNNEKERPNDMYTQRPVNKMFED